MSTQLGTIVDGMRVLIINSFCGPAKLQDRRCIQLSISERHVKMTRDEILQLIGWVLPTDLAQAVLDMDDIGWSEGLGPTGDFRQEAWDRLVKAAEVQSGRKADRTP
ncbi:MAG: hypothetical protein ACYS7Y_26965 [Planctomycetota bacterium]|jgi:hypothetical protein